MKPFELNIILKREKNILCSTVLGKVVQPEKGDVIYIFLNMTISIG